MLHNKSETERRHRPAQRVEPIQLSLSTSPPVDAVDQIRQGYAASAVKDLAGLLGSSDVQVAAALRISRSAVARRQRDAQALTRDASDRLYRAFRVFELTAETLGDRAAARTWFRREHSAFGGATALSLMDTTAGYELVQHELSRITHGVCA